MDDEILEMPASVIDKAIKAMMKAHIYLDHKEGQTELTAEIGSALSDMVDAENDATATEE